MGWWRRSDASGESGGANAGRPDGEPLAVPASHEVRVAHFKAALELLREHHYEEAVEAFAAVEAECQHSTAPNVRALAKGRRAVALTQLGRYGEAAALLDELACDREALAKIVSDSPDTDEVATIYSNRIHFHRELGHWPKVHSLSGGPDQRDWHRQHPETAPVRS